MTAYPYPYIYIPYYRVFGSLSSNHVVGQGSLSRSGALARPHLDISLLMVMEVSNIEMMHFFDMKYTLRVS
ncbi:shikimate kinase [Paenibacillus amylolyticus]|uniref:Shikimate kinase n=1 Tax=Paenibacillus amylolyticus TaxID=1451 RepID=A0A100VRZ8_PAEAM|nr:shikimate kinase [Paenibacillus amylolyticus]